MTSKCDQEKKRQLFGGHVDYSCQSLFFYDIHQTLLFKDRSHAPSPRDTILHPAEILR